MIKQLSCIVGMAIAFTAMAQTAEREKIVDVHDLKPGMCVAASVVYHQGELLEMGDETKVCTSINGHDLWLTVDQKALEEMSH